MLQPRLTKVEPLEPSRLRLFYETGEVKLFDVSPYLSGPWYGQLKEPAYFRTVRLLPGGGGIEWSGGQDIAPHELYEQGTPVESPGWTGIPEEAPDEWDLRMLKEIEEDPDCHAFASDEEVKQVLEGLE